MSIEETDVSHVASRPAPTGGSSDASADDNHSGKPTGAGPATLNPTFQNSLIQDNDALPQEGEVIKPVSFAPLQGKVKKQGFQLKPIHVGLGTTLFILASVALYLFTAKSVHFETSPPNGTVIVSDGFSIRIGEGFLMHSGDYTVKATLEGYHPIEQLFSVDDRQNQIVELSLRKLPGLLTVTTNISEPGTVMLDGIDVGNLNHQIDNIEPGEYRLTVNTDRFLPFNDVVNIEGKTIEQTHSIQLQPAWANVDITTEPAGANITVDGEVIGQTPMSAEILQGERAVTLKLAGFKSWNQTFDIFAGNNLVLDPVILDKSDGLVAIASRPNAASITVNGNYYGQTPMELALAPGQDYQVTLFKDGYQTAKKSISVVSGREQSIDINLLASLGKIRIRAVPEDALLYVDGRLMGRANQEISLPAKQTQIRIKKEGFADYLTTILPRPKLDQSIPVRLKTLEQVKWEKIKPMIVSKAGQQLKLFKPEDSFSVGSSRREQGRRANESLRNVSLSRPFYLGIHEVTNGQFRKFERQHLSGNVKGQSLDSDDFPVVNVSWQQAALYCNWLSTQEGLPLFYIVEEGEVTGFHPQSSGFRMATEAEWAWAARFEKGFMLKYAWGSELLPPAVLANIADRNAASVAGYIQPSYDDGYAVSAPVGSFSANSKGLFDLSGNVSEWLNDFYEVSASFSQKTIADPIGPLTGSFHAIRGSSWAHGGTTELRLSYRDYGLDARNDLGFRIARFVD